MKRRDFITTSAGFMAFVAAPGVFSVDYQSDSPKRTKFRDYRKNKSLGKVQIVTPDDGFYLHTFYDVCPFSPSQKLLAVNKIPFQGKAVKYGDLCDVCIVDLENETIEKVYSTKGWGYQLGANLNWGKTDRYLYTNDIIGDDAVCVRIDLETKEIKAFAGPMYHIAPDESAVVGFPLDMINATQMGYGVPAFRKCDGTVGSPADQGLWRTDLKTNKKTLLVSIQDVYQKAKDKEFLNDGNGYLFHSKFNPQGTRILQVVRYLFPENSAKEGRNPMLYAFNSDGSDVHQAITRVQWSLRGNHPNWHPDGERIVMNLTPAWLGDNEMRFCIFHHTGKDFRILSKKFLGSGHPSLTPDSSYLLSDYYAKEYKKLGLTESPIRLIDLNTEKEESICSVFTDLDVESNTFRIDPHPAWSRDFKKVCFNGAPNGVRQVFVADLSNVLG
ncbi:TolB family protein [Mariniphaga anaerophila]|nr:hypothetical protein [Mariniphaga anaerophila]